MPVLVVFCGTLGAVVIMWTSIIGSWSQGGMLGKTYGRMLEVGLCPSPGCMSWQSYGRRGMTIGTTAGVISKFSARGLHYFI